MLFISRKIKEKITLSKKGKKEEILIIFEGFRGKQISLGIDAPKEYLIKRIEDEKTNGSK